MIFCQAASDEGGGIVERLWYNRHTVNRYSSSEGVFMGEISLKQTVDKRRTFAIISHPDAGKTTITEQMLLFGGAIDKREPLKPKKVVNLRHLTGWKLKNNVEFL